MSNKVHIIIPHYNNWGLTHSRLWELFKIAKNDIHSVTVVDDASTDSMTEGGLRWWADMTTKLDGEFRVEALQLEENVGFLKASNRGIHYVIGKSAPDDIIVLLSNDVKVMTNFIGQMTEILRQDQKVVGGILYTHNTGWNKFGDKIFPYLEGWLLAMKAKDWNLFGGLDERYVPCDYEDMDLSTSALSLGYELVPLNNPGLQHIGGQSIGYSDERFAQTKINQKKFEEQWCKDE